MAAPQFFGDGVSTEVVPGGKSKWAKLLMQHLRLMWPDDNKLDGDVYSPYAAGRVRQWQATLGKAVVARADGKVGTDTWAEIGRLAGTSAANFAGVPSKWLSKDLWIASAAGLGFLRSAVLAGELALQSIAPGLIGNFRMDYGAFFAEFYREAAPLPAVERAALAQFLWALDTDVFLAKTMKGDAALIERSAAYFLATAFHETDKSFAPNQERLAGDGFVERKYYPLSDDFIADPANGYVKWYEKDTTQKDMDRIGPNVKRYCKLQSIQTPTGVVKRIYNGRGFVHITWDYNYEKFDALLHGRANVRYQQTQQGAEVKSHKIKGVPEAVLLDAKQSLFASPELAYDTQIAYATLSLGVRQNLWIGTGSADRFRELMSKGDYGQARLLVNADAKQGPGPGWSYATNVKKFEVQCPIFARMLHKATRPRPAWAKLIGPAAAQAALRKWQETAVTRRVPDLLPTLVKLLSPGTGAAKAGRP